MNAPKDIYAEMKQQLISELETHIKKDNNYTIEYAQLFYEITPKCSIPQLWRLYYSYVLRNQKFEILPCDPTDHLAFRLGDIYVGIEIDGYAHS